MTLARTLAEKLANELLIQDHYLGFIEDAEKAIEAVYGWQDIATAPHDGRELYGYAPGWKHPFPVRWSHAAQRFVVVQNQYTSYKIKNQPTMWAILPTPPQLPTEVAEALRQ